MARTQTVTIPLDEYKELLLRDRPSEHEKEVLEKLLGIISEQMEYRDSISSYYSGNMGDHLYCEDCSKLLKEVLTMLKYVDREMYMGIWNAVATAERERRAKEAMVSQMNEAREIRAE